MIVNPTDLAAAAAEAARAGRPGSRRSRVAYRRLWPAVDTLHAAGWQNREIARWLIERQATDANLRALEQAISRYLLRKLRSQRTQTHGN